jgi:hypothetical protein
MQLEEYVKFETFNDLIGIRICDLLAYSIAPEIAEQESAHQMFMNCTIPGNVFFNPGQWTKSRTPVILSFKKPCETTKGKSILHMKLDRSIKMC